MRCPTPHTCASIADRRPSPRIRTDRSAQIAGARGILTLPLAPLADQQTCIKPKARQRALSNAQTAGSQMMTNIKHRPNIDVSEAERLYTRKDGVPVKYVCTTSLGSGTRESDVFFRETPHPEFGNRYFGLCYVEDKLYIHSADHVEDLVFDMLEVNGRCYYSKSRWDYHSLPDGSVIDGGRAYTRVLWPSGKLPKRKSFKIKDGKFERVNHE